MTSSQVAIHHVHVHVLSLNLNFENTVELLKITQGGGVKNILDGNMGGSILKISKVWGGGSFYFKLEIGKKFPAFR